MASQPNGIICSSEDYARSLFDKSIYCLTRGQSLGLMVVAQAGLLSLLAVLYIFSIIIRNVFARIRFSRGGRWQLLEEPIDILMLSLFFADLIQALGGLMDFRWIVEGKVEIGNYCTAQGVIQQFGETGVALSTLVIAVYTFIGIWWRKGAGAILETKIVIGLIWLFLILMVVIGNVIHRDKHELFESPTPYWCWLGQGFLQFRLWGEYIWFWVTLTFSLMTYIPLYFWSRGNLSRDDDDSWWRFSVHRANGSPELKARRRYALTMLAYPLIYCAVILPLSVVRWIGFVQEGRTGKENISSAATLAVGAIYWLGGVCNVILLLTTRPSSVLFGRPVDYDNGHAPPPENNGLWLGRILGEEDMDGAQQGDLPLVVRQDDAGQELGRLPSR